jgi:hypothetical protein
MNLMQWSGRSGWEAEPAGIGSFPKAEHRGPIEGRRLPICDTADCQSALPYLRRFRTWAISWVVMWTGFVLLTGCI